MSPEEIKRYNEEANAQYYSQIANASRCPDCYQVPCKCSQSYADYLREKSKPRVIDGYHNYLCY